MQNSRPVYAGFFIRFFAYLIDMLIVGIALLGYKIAIWVLSVSSPDNFMVRNLLFEYSLADIISYACVVLYFILMTRYAGATLGKKLLHLRVVSADGGRLTWTNIIYRETIGRFLSEVILFIGYFMIAVDEEKKALHDILCDTRVVYMHPQKRYYVPLQPARPINPPSLQSSANRENPSPLQPSVNRENPPSLQPSANRENPPEMPTVQEENSDEENKQNN